MNELEKEIRKYLKETFHHEYYDDVVMVMGFAEPREKRIAELEKKLTEKVTLESLDVVSGKVTELEAQIEKMKCCFNCKHSRTEYEHCKTNKHEKWEIKEK